MFSTLVFLRLALISSSDGSSSSCVSGSAAFLVGLLGGDVGDGVGLTLAGKAATCKSLPDHSEIEATHGAK